VAEHAFEFLENPAEADMLEVKTALRTYNRKHWELTENPDYVFRLKDGDRLLAGAVFNIFGNWLELDYLWVCETERGKGMGGALLDRVENFGRSRGCGMMFLSTLSFQAPGFYRKAGFTQVYRQDGYPKTSARYFFEKKL
jgi:GNAT superfamily N-acetyltransferase